MNPDELAELEEQRAFLVRSLDDLDRELGAGDIDVLDASTLREDYTHRLAEVQRAIETGRAEILHQAPPRRRGRTAAVVLVVALAAGGAGVAVASTAGSRKPGDTATGNIRENTNNKLAEAAGLQDDGEYLEAVKVYDAIIERDPGNAEALAERGFVLLRISMGSEQPELVRSGRDYIERALDLEPKNPRWIFYKAAGLQLAGDPDGASAAFDEALANNPPPALRADIEAVRGSLGR